METVEFGTYQLPWCHTQQRKGKQMSYKDEMDANDKKEAKTKEEITPKVWAEAIADAERKIEVYKRRIAIQRATLRILRGLKKNASAGKK